MVHAVLSTNKLTGETFYHGFSNSDNSIQTGSCDIKPNAYMQEQFKKSVDKAGAIGLHLVHIFYKDAISGELDCRKAYFDTYADAVLYAFEYDKAHEGKKQTYLIYINCELYRGRFNKEDAKEFMGIAQDKITEVSK